MYQNIHKRPSDKPTLHLSEVYPLEMMQHNMKNNTPPTLPFKYNSFSLLRQSNLLHGFFTRDGGVSTDNRFASLNFCKATPEEELNVSQNQEIVAKSFGLPPQNLKVVSQKHTAVALSVLSSEYYTEDIIADALVTNQKKVILSVRTADCVPILFYEPNNKIIAVAHAGWKGALAGILENTILAIEDLGGMRTSIIVAIGPCIQQHSYEVDSAFKATFLDTDAKFEIFFSPSTRSGHFMFDLPGFCAYKLRNFGILKLENIGIDTYSNPEVLFSYRRTTHEEGNSGALVGNQISAIAMV